MPRNRDTNQHTKGGMEVAETDTTLPRGLREWQIRYTMKLLACGRQIAVGMDPEATGFAASTLCNGTCNSK